MLEAQFKASAADSIIFDRKIVLHAKPKSVRQQYQPLSHLAPHYHGTSFKNHGLFLLRFFPNWIIRKNIQRKTQQIHFQTQTIYQLHVMHIRFLRISSKKAQHAVHKLQQNPYSKIHGVTPLSLSGLPGNHSQEIFGATKLQIQLCQSDTLIHHTYFLAPHCSLLAETLMWANNQQPLTQVSQPVPVSVVSD